jgi:hypothetical protein
MRSLTITDNTPGSLAATLLWDVPGEGMDTGDDPSTANFTFEVDGVVRALITLFWIDNFNLGIVAAGAAAVTSFRILQHTEDLDVVSLEGQVAKVPQEKTALV